MHDHSKPNYKILRAKQTRQPKSSMTCKFTHNEQLLVRCCGIVIARATFYEAESLSNVVVSLLKPVMTISYADMILQ